MSQSVPRRRAPRNSLSAELIVDRALSLLDDKGMEAFSMRALAEELGVGTMALYTYFRGKEELFHAARDRVLSTYQPPCTSGRWDEQLRAVCLSMYELFTGQPSVLQLLAEGQAEGDFADAASVTMERVVELLRGSGLDRQAAARAAGTVIGFTIGSAMRQVRECGKEGQLTAKTELLRRRFAALSPERHPALTDLSPELTVAREDGPGQYTFGLDLILCGLRDLAAAGATAPQS
ncbi:TetR/AcrR family transcriptional regulator [Streptacidiphilus carbonis]|uniref:TetR/AcrR family transcriptional regulator n=1 Tax=Streptacidiphilus carbonis TaxID=105422 RepID=UPI0005A913BF|nr:TetR/AcrR family transcriptional regulator [Streptacidiphilus carbonis]